MTGYVREIVGLAGKYGLKISSMDATDVTIIARLELVPAISFKFTETHGKAN